MHRNYRFQGDLGGAPIVSAIRNDTTTMLIIKVMLLELLFIEYSKLCAILNAYVHFII